MSVAERRRRDQVNAMLRGNVAHATKVAESVRAAVADGRRDEETAAVMLRSIDAKVARWRREMYS